MTKLTDAIELLDRLTQTGHDPRSPAVPLYEVVTQRMHDALPGQPGSSMGGGGSGRGGSPVEAAAMALLESGRDDRARSDLAEWQTLEARILADAIRLTRLAQSCAPRQPSMKALRETEHANVRLCEHCHDAPPDSDEPTDLAGRLAKPLLLCLACRHFETRHGRMSTPRDRETIARGGRVRDRVTAR